MHAAAAAAAVVLLVALAAVQPASAGVIAPLQLQNEDYGDSLPVGGDKGYGDSRKRDESSKFLPVLPNDDYGNNAELDDLLSGLGGSKERKAERKNANNAYDDNGKWDQFNGYKGRKVSKAKKARKVYNDATQPAKSNWGNDYNDATQPAKSNWGNDYNDAAKPAKSNWGNDYNDAAKPAKFNWGNDYNDAAKPVKTKRGNDYRQTINTNSYESASGEAYANKGYANNGYSGSSSRRVSKSRSKSSSAYKRNNPLNQIAQKAIAAVQSMANKQQEPLALDYKQARKRQRGGYDAASSSDLGIGFDASYSAKNVKSEYGRGSSSSSKSDYSSQSDGDDADYLFSGGQGYEQQKQQQQQSSYRNIPKQKARQNRKQAQKIEMYKRENEYNF